jgi:hypothetical protein
MKSSAAEISQILETDSSAPHPWRDVWFLIIAATALGAAIQVRDGLYDPRGFVGLTVAVLATLLIFLPRRFRQLDALGEKHLATFFTSAIAINFLQLFSTRFIGSQHGVLSSLFSGALLAIAACICLAIIRIPRLSHWLLLGLVIDFCILGGWIIRSVPQPYMDVWMLQTEGLKAFCAGHNPFAAAFPDLYHRPELYAPGVLKDGLVHQGFPYPPMVFWLDLPGYLLGGDYRWSNLACIALAAVLIAFARKGSRLGPLAAALFLFTPRVFFVLESGWTEPTTILLFAATIFCACRLPRLMPICLGLFLCSKQYLIWAIPPILLLAGRPIKLGKVIRTLAIAFIAGCVVSLPLIFWDVHAFITANFGIADTARFRMDALSYLALFANLIRREPSALAATLIGFTAALGATAFATLRGRRTPSGYAVAVAFGHLIFFCFYKFAFCNYYYFLIAVFCCALGAMRIVPSVDRAAVSTELA